MLDGLKPYPAYKESGVPWLGRIPAHWDVSRNGRLFSRRDERGNPGLPILEVSLRTGVRVRDLEAGGRKQAMSDLEGYRRAVRGDIAYNTMRMWQGAVGVVPTTGLVSPAYVVARPNDGVDATYFSHLFRTDAYREQIDGYSRGIVKDRNRLYWEDFKRITSPLPPLGEQNAIVKVLGSVDRLLHRFVESSLKLLRLTEELRTCSISRMNRRSTPMGGNPAESGSFSNAGVGTDDAVPRSLGRYLSAIEQGWSPLAAEGEVEEGQWAVLALSAIQRGRFDPFAVKPIPKTAQIPDQLMVREGDVLLTRSNTRARVGDACLATGVRPRTIFSDLIYRLTPRRTALDARFLVLQLLSAEVRAQIERDARGSSDTMPKIGQSQIKRLQIPVPPLPEQVSAAARVEMELDSTDQFRMAVHRQLRFVREWRERLGTALTGGSLNVRDVVGAIGGAPSEEDSTVLAAPSESEADPEDRDFLEPPGADA